MTCNSLIPPSGGFRKLRSFNCAQSIYDGTVVFCSRFIDKKSRTHDQMVQAARSGVQNIAEGSLASATSKKMELKLTSVARASLGELLLDYEDYLRQNNLHQWQKSSPEAERMATASTKSSCPLIPRNCPKYNFGGYIKAIMPTIRVSSSIPSC